MNEIKMYIHCKKCMSELPEGTSRAEFSSQETGWTDSGLQVWCKRHDCSILHLEHFEIGHDQEIEK